MMNFLARIQRPLGIITLLCLGAGIWLVFNAPLDFQQGNSVRILYAHVPSAKMSLFCYILLTISSIIYLVKKSETADIIAEATVPVGAAFTAVTLASGSLWGKPMWGTWWAWDARLTSMLVLLILYMGLMALRSSLEEPLKAARATAILAIIGAVDLPIIHYSVVWWRTLHQPPSFGGSSGNPSITGDLLPPLVVMAVAFILMGAYMVIVKAREVVALRQLEELDIERMEEND
ncbi:MAG: cytochrome c biogenesis protein CcsA [Magnetococcales bacterium]|nr:cytochrome c biogenesis protein CcsA [Magnetococcales bacterium]